MILRNKTVAVTGASRGLGLAVSKAFSDAGATVVMLARTSSDLKHAARSVAGSMPVVCDVSSPEQVRVGFASIKAQFEGLDVLVNNAAVGRPQPIEEADDKLVQLEVGVNLLGPLYCMREAIPMLRDRGGGDIVNVTSEAVRNPYPLLGLYAATKSALETLSASVRREVKGSGTRVTVYRSGRIAGTFSRDWDPKMTERARAAAKEEGFYRRSGQARPVEAAAADILELVLLDRSVRVDLFEPEKTQLS